MPFFLRIALIAFVGVALACGCGKKTPPIPPDSLVPGEVRNFTVRQDGPAVRLEWLFPRINIDNQPLTDIQGFYVLRSQETLTYTAGCPPELKPVANIDLAFPQAGEVQGEQVRYRDDNLEPGNRYFYQVVGYDRGEHLGLPTPVVSQVWDVLPQAPATLEAQAGDRQAMLTWPAVTRLADGKPLSGGANYNIYREAQGSGFIRVNTAPVIEPKFQDIAVANDVTYRYLVRTVRQVGSSSLESLDSPGQTVKPVDQTPPAPVLNLVAVATDKGIELRWEPGREPDLAGYQVYRRSLAEPQFRVLTAQLVAAPYFVDSDTAKGVTYYYYVVAVDTSRRANQSFPSETVEVTR